MTPKPGTSCVVSSPAPTGDVFCINRNRPLRRAWQWRGSRDAIGDKIVGTLKEALSGGESSVDVKNFAESGHLAHLDEREEYVTVSVGGGLMSAGAASRLHRGPSVLCFAVVGGWKEREADNKMRQSVVNILYRPSGSLLSGTFFTFIDHCQWMGILGMKPCGHTGYHTSYVFPD